MKAQPNRQKDKELLINLSDFLNTSLERLKLDGCGDWNIFGKRGHISTDSQLWYVYTEAETKRQWSAIKTKLKFMEVSQDGDDEGILKLERMPSPGEGKAIREVLGLRKRPDLSEEQRVILSERILNTRKDGV